MPVIALAQLNRRAEEVDVPMVSHIRDSGSIEQDADTIMLIHQDRSIEACAVEVEQTLMLAKNRGGPKGEVALEFDKRVQRMTGDSAPLVM